MKKMTLCKVCELSKKAGNNYKCYVCDKLAEGEENEDGK